MKYGPKWRDLRRIFYGLPFLAFGGSLSRTAITIRHCFRFGFPNSTGIFLLHLGFHVGDVSWNFEAAMIQRLSQSDFGSVLLLGSLVEYC